MLLNCLILLWAVLQTSLCDQWPYNRYYGKKTRSGEFVADGARAVRSNRTQDRFIHWLHDISETQDSGEVRRMFINNTIPRNATNLDEVFGHLEPPPLTHPVPDASHLLPPMIPNLPAIEAEKLLKKLNYALDPKCTVDKSNWWSEPLTDHVTGSRRMSLMKGG